jgi:hypothetical protein
MQPEVITPPHTFHSHHERKTTAGEVPERTGFGPPSIVVVHGELRPDAEAGAAEITRRVHATDQTYLAVG